MDVRYLLTGLALIAATPTFCAESEDEATESTQGQSLNTAIANADLAKIGMWSGILTGAIACAADAGYNWKIAAAAASLVATGNIALAYAKSYKADAADKDAVKAEAKKAAGKFVVSTLATMGSYKAGQMTLAAFPAIGQYSAAGYNYVAAKASDLAQGTKTLAGKAWNKVKFW